MPDAMANLSPVPPRVERRAGPHVSRHHVDGVLGCRKRRNSHRRHRGSLRPGTDRPLCRSGRPADGRDHGHRRRYDSGAARHGATHWASITRSTTSNDDPVKAILELTDGRGVDASIEALGTQGTFEAALRVLDLAARCPAWVSIRPTSAFRSMPSRPASATRGSSRRSAPAGRSACDASWTSSLQAGSILDRLVTHRFKLDEIEEAYELFSHQRDGVLKVAITP